MAKTTTARKAPTTALTTATVVPMPRSNQPDVIDEKLIIAAVDQAVRDQDEGGKKLGSAVQRMAYAVIAEHNRLATDRDNKDLPKLDLVSNSSKSVGAMMRLLTVRFLGEMPKSEQNASPEHLSAERAYGNHKALLRRAILLASLLRRCNLGLAQFNGQVGNWNVPAMRLFPKGVVPLGNLNTAMVLLDGRTYAGTKGVDTFVKVQASVDQFTKMDKPEIVTPTARTDAGQGATSTVDLAKASVKELSGKLDTDTGRLLVLATYRNLLNRFANPIDKELARPGLSDLPPTERNTLTDLAKLYDELKARDASKAQAKSA